MRALWPRVALLPLLLLLCTHGDAQYTLLAAPVCTLGAFFCSSANLTGGRAGEILSLDARATTVVFDWRVDTFVHNASAVNTVCCSLDGVPVPYCSLPYSTPRLVPGVHTFNATYLDPSTQAVGAAVTATWEVRPRLVLSHSRVHMTVAVPTRGEARVTVRSAAPHAPLAPGQVECALLEAAHAESLTGLGVECDAGTVVVVSVDSFERGANASAAAATVLVRDGVAAAVGVTSELALAATATLFVSKLRLFPSAHVAAAELGLDARVTAGAVVEGMRVQLLSVADGLVEGTLNWTVSRTYAWARADGGGGAVMEASNVPALANRSLVLLGSNQTHAAVGNLTYSGAMHDLALSFPPAPPAFVGLWVQQFAVTSTLDPAPIMLRVSMRVVAGAVSRLSAVAFAETHAAALDAATGAAVVTAGGAVQLTVRPRDRFNNSIGGGDGVYEIFMRRAAGPASGTWVVTEPAFSPLASTAWAAVYDGSVLGVAPAGGFTVTVSALVDGAVLPLVELPVRAVAKVCDASQQRATVASGTACVCVAGFEASGFAADGGIKCHACATGWFSAAGTACVACPGATTTAGTNATSPAACVCRPGYFSRGDACALCPQGSYSATPGGARCDLCPPGTITDVQGMRACDICADPHASTRADDRVTCHCADDWYDGALGAASNVSTASANRCKRCPRGARCRDDALVAQRGWWRRNRGEERLHRCRAGYCGREEEEGTAGYAAHGSVCRPGHTGVLCATCVEGFALQGAFCEPCDPSQGHSPALLIPIIAVTVGVSVLLWLTLPLFLDGDAVARSLQRAADWVEIRVLRALGRKPGQLLRLDTLLSRSKSGLSRAASRSASAAAFDSPESRWSASSSHSAGGASLDSQMGEMRAIQKMLQRRSSRDEAWMRVRGSFKIVIGFYQVLASLDDVYTIPWPQRMLDFFATVQVVELNVFTMPVMSCVYPNPNFYVTLHAMMVLPFFVAVAMMVLYKLQLALCATMRTDRELRRRMSYHFVHSLLFFMFLMYPSLCTKVLNVYNCVEVHGEYYLVADMRRKCQSRNHLMEMVLGAVGVLLYPIGIPALFLMLMRQHSVPQLAYYKKARFVVLRMVKHVALSVPQVHAYVSTHSERIMFEDLPLPLLRLVAFTLLPPPVPEAAEERDGEVGEHGEAVEAPLDEVESHPPAEKENNEAAPEAAVVGEDVKAVEAPAESGGIVDRQSFGELSQKAEEAWRRPSALDIDIDWEPEPSHWPQDQAREDLVAVLMVFAKEDPRGKALCSPPAMGWLEGIDGGPIQRGHSTYFEKRQMLAFARLSLVFNMYQVDVWWYEILDLGRKLLLNGVLLFIGPDSAAQVALGSFICAVMVCVSVALRPYIDEAHNNLSLLCLVHLTVTLYVGLLLKVNTLGPGPLLTVLISFIILICVCIVAVPIVHLLLALSGLTDMARTWHSRFLERHPVQSNLQAMIEVPRALTDKASNFFQQEDDDQVPDVTTAGGLVLQEGLFARVTHSLSRRPSSLGRSLSSSSEGMRSAARLQSWVSSNSRERMTRTLSEGADRGGSVL